MLKVTPTSNGSLPLRRGEFETIVEGLDYAARGKTGCNFFSSRGELDQALAFREGEYVDLETQSVWDFGGRAVAGELEGRSLVPAPTRSTFWFAYVAAFPDVRVASP